MRARHVKIAPGGRVVVPAEFRRALGVDIGDDVVIELTNGELRLRSLDAAIQRAQEIVRKYVPKGVSLADELIVNGVRRPRAKRTHDLRSGRLNRARSDPGGAGRGAGRAVVRQAALSSVNLTEFLTKLIGRGVPLDKVRLALEGGHTLRALP